MADSLKRPTDARDLELAIKAGPAAVRAYIATRAARSVNLVIETSEVLLQTPGKQAPAQISAAKLLIEHALLEPSKSVGSSLSDEEAIKRRAKLVDRARALSEIEAQLAREAN